MTSTPGVIGRTSTFGFNLIDYGYLPWDELDRNNWRTLDAVLANYFALLQLRGIWQNSADYVVGDRAVDSANSTIWTCLVSHTSEAEPTTFAEDRSAFPARWEQLISDDLAAVAAAQLAQAAAQQAAADAAAASAFASTVRARSAFLCETVNNLNLAVVNRPIIDGTQPDYGQKVLLAAQTDSSENGLYVVTSPGDGGWVRDADMNSNEDLAYNIWIISIEAGGSHIGKGFFLTTDGTLTLGTSALTFRELGQSAVITPLQSSNGSISIPAASPTNDGFMTKEDVVAVRNGPKIDLTNTWTAVNTFEQRVRILQDFAIRDPSGFFAIFATGGNINKSITFRFVNTGQSSADIAVLGTRPVMSDGTVGSKFVGEMGFFNATPVSRQTGPATSNAATGSTPTKAEFDQLATNVNTLMNALRAYNLITTV